MSSRLNFSNWLGLAGTIFAALLGVSCGGGMAQNGQGSSPVPASLSLNASSMDFGSVNVNSSKSSTLKLTNSSASDGPSVTFSQVATTGSGFSATTSPALPIVLAPGETANITVKFAPKAAGVVNGTLSISVDGASDPATVTLKGNGTSTGTPQLTVSPSTLNFGTVTIGSNKRMTATLTAGSADVRVSSAAWSGSGYSVSGITFPVTVAAGKSVSFNVNFAPQGSGTLQGSITFVSNAPNSPTIQKFSGTGAQAQPQNSTQHTVQLSWSASSSAVQGYYTYRSTQSGGPYTQLNSLPNPDTDYADDTVDSGTTYYYVVTAVDDDWLESNYSSQVRAIIPNP